MKTSKLLVLLVLLFTATTSGFASKKITGESNTQMGKYTIEKSNNQIEHKGQLLETYSLKYEYCEKKLLIGIEEEKGCKNFIVQWNDMQIIYACQKGIFGAKRLPKQKSTQIAINEAIDRQQFYFQKVITRKQKTEKQLLALIACYYPQLINEDYIINHS